MTKEQAKMMQAVTAGVLAARVELADARDQISGAADECKGNPMEDRLNSWYDEIEDLIYDMKKQLEAWKDNLENGGCSVPDSWKEAI